MREHLGFLDTSSAVVKITAWIFCCRQKTIYTPAYRNAGCSAFCGRRTL